MGGIKQAFRHVEALADAGWSAYILIAETKAQNWFNSRAPLARVRAHPFAAIMNRLDIKRNSLDWIGASTSPPVWLSDEKRWSRFDADDIIVVPEFYGNQLPPCRFVSVPMRSAFFTNASLF